MPYIKQENRVEKDKLISQLLEECEAAGDFNYVITALLHQLIRREGKNYTNLNAVIGILECAKLELYRVVVAAYEDIKIIENGLVLELDDEINTSKS